MRQDFALLLVHLISVDATSIHLRPCEPGHVMTPCATVLLHCGGAIKHGHGRGDSKTVRGCAHGSDYGAGAALTAVASAKAGATANAAIRVTWAADAAISQRMAAPEHGRIRESRNFQDRRKLVTDWSGNASETVSWMCGDVAKGMRAADARKG